MSEIPNMKILLEHLYRFPIPYTEDFRARYCRNVSNVRVNNWITIFVLVNAVSGPVPSPFQLGDFHVVDF